MHGADKPRLHSMYSHVHGEQLSVDAMYCQHKPGLHRVRDLQHGAIRVCRVLC